MSSGEEDRCNQRPGISITAVCSLQSAVCSSMQYSVYSILYCILYGTVRNTEYGTEYRIQNTEYIIQNTEYRIQSTECTRTHAHI